MSASVTATASQTQTEELAWIPTCLRAVGVPPAAAPPWLPPRLPAVPPRHRAPLPNVPETRGSRERGGGPSQKVIYASRTMSDVSRFHFSKNAIGSGDFWRFLKKNGLASFFLPKKCDTGDAAWRTNGIKMICGTAGSKKTTRTSAIRRQNLSAVAATTHFKVAGNGAS